MSTHSLYIILLRSLDKELSINNLHKFMVKIIDFTSIFENPPLTELKEVCIIGVHFKQIQVRRPFMDNTNAKQATKELAMALFE